MLVQDADQHWGRKLCEGNALSGGAPIACKEQRKKKTNWKLPNRKKAFNLIRLQNLIKEYNKIIKLIKPDMIDHLQDRGFFVFKVTEGKKLMRVQSIF